MTALNLRDNPRLLIHARTVALYISTTPEKFSYALVAHKDNGGKVSIREQNQQRVI
jgi:hypothetical protein